jgi:hypothetical protein
MLCGTAWARDKTDVITMLNGDRLTGEIKQLEKGKLVVGTDSMGEVLIEWKDIARIQSSYEFQFERSDGTRVTGAIQDSPDLDKITLVGDDEAFAFRRENIVRISQIEDSFWDRLNGSFSFGYNFTKASDVAQGNLGFRATHRTEIRSFTLDGSTTTTSAIPPHCSHCQGGLGQVRASTPRKPARKINSAPTMFIMYAPTMYPCSPCSKSRWHTGQAGRMCTHLRKRPWAPHRGQRSRNARPAMRSPPGKPPAAPLCAFWCGGPILPGSGECLIQ